MKTISKKELMEFLREEKKASIANKQYSKESSVNKAYYEGMVLAQNRTIEFIKKMLRNYEI